MINQNEYIETLRTSINSICTCYFEEAPKSASFPYCVLVPPATSNIDYGDMFMFDLEVFTNEINGAEELETTCDDLRNYLNNKTLNLENKFSSHIGFENYISIKDTEQDLLCRRLTFSARIIYN